MKKKIKPISTNVEKLFEISEQKFIALEDYFGFEGASNIYCIEKGNIIWYAEKTHIDDIFVNMVKIDSNTISAFTWKGFNEIIDINTGKIIEVVFVK